MRARAPRTTADARDVRRLALVLALLAVVACVAPAAHARVADPAAAVAAAREVPFEEPPPAEEAPPPVEEEPPPAEPEPDPSPPPASDPAPEPSPPPADPTPADDLPADDLPADDPADLPIHDVPLDDLVLAEGLDDLDPGLEGLDEELLADAVGAVEVAGPPAQLGRRVAVVPAPGGVVRVRRPGARRSTVLGGAEGVPVGAVLDLRRGAVAVRSAQPGGRADAVTVLAGGVVEVRQGADGVLELRLRGPAASCPGHAERRPRARAAKARTLAGAAAGSGGAVRVVARDSATIARGGAWLVTETCTGTRTTAIAGTPAVRDRGARRAVRVRAGRSHLARRRTR